MDEQIVISFDELSSMLSGETLHLDEDEHEVIKNADESVTIVVDPENAKIVGDDFVGVGVSLSDDIYLRLNSFGYEDISEFDKSILRFLLDKVQKTVRNIINVNNIPDELHYQIVDATCAEFLKLKYAMGKLKVEFSDSPIASIKEGDTTVTYSSSTSTSITPQRVLLNILNDMELNKAELTRFRRFVW